MKRILTFVAIAFLFSSKLGFADAIPVFNTGVDNSGQVLANGAIDPHWSIVGTPVTIGDPPAYTATSAAGYPASGPWIGDNSTSAWINPSSTTPNSDLAVGDWTYETTFDITGDPSTADLLGQFAADDEVVEILLNGVDVGPAASGGYTSWTPFSIDSSFVSGENTLDFVVYNDGGPSGLRVEFDSTEQTSDVPEPGSMALLGSGLVGLGGLIRRRFKAS